MESGNAAGFDAAKRFRLVFRHRLLAIEAAAVTFAVLHKWKALKKCCNLRGSALVRSGGTVFA